MNKMKKFFIFCVLAVMVLAIPLDLVSSAQERGGKPPLKIVHLGESYSAGNGARCENDEYNYIYPGGCYRSPTNWGSQYAQRFSDRFAVTYINRACSGSVVRHIHNTRLILKFDARPDGYCGIDTDETYYKSSYNQYGDPPTTTCYRYLRPQIEAIDESVDLVLMSIGGNDLGFDDIVSGCFAVGPRSPRKCRGAVVEAIDEMPGLQQDLIDTFTDLRARMRPDARILYVSYPHIMLDIDYQLRSWGVGQAYDVREAVRGLAIAGKAAQRAAVDAANAAAGDDFVKFFDGTMGVFNKKEPDPRATRRNPDRWINEFEGKLHEWYHFNPLGHKNLALRLPYVTDLFDYEPPTPPYYDKNGHIDIAFVVETNYIMHTELSVLSGRISDVVEHIARTTESYRVSIVSYRDFPELSGEADDYPSRVHQTFTDDLDLIQEAIDSLSNFTHLGGHGATVFSGIQTALELPWRPCVTQVLVVIGALPPYSSPEPISGLTVSDIIANSIALGPVQVYGVDYISLNEFGEVGEIADGTGGFMMGKNQFKSTMLEMIIPQPYGCFGNPYSGMIGESVIFDASGFYNPSGSEIKFFEWDFDGDGVFDLKTKEPIAFHKYEEEFDGYVIVRVTSASGNFTLASVRVDVNEQGYASQGDEDPCDLDENGYSIILDDEGRFIRCTPTNLPDKDQEGVAEVTGRTMTVTKVGQGRVTSDPAGIDCGATCMADFVYNTVVTLTAAPAAGWTFAGWGGACTGAGTCTVTMRLARNVTATFTSVTPPTTDFKIYLPLITR